MISVPPRILKKIMRRLYYGGAIFFSFCVRLMPYRIAVPLGGFLGLVAYHTVGKARRTAETNLARAFPDMAEDERKEIARKVFINQGKNLFELFSFPKLAAEDILRLAAIENRQALVEAFKQGKGVLIASAHCGNWEMMGAALSLSGFPINVIARRIYVEGLNRMLVGFRNSKGVRVILRSDRESAREMLRSLRHNEAIGILIDQDTAVPGVFVPFFSRPAWTPSGLATLALKTGAAVVLALDERSADDRHVVHITGPLELRNTGNREQDIRDTTRLFSALIEEHVRRYPDQWVWMHERWKTQPS